MGVLPINPTSNNDIQEMNTIQAAKNKNRHIGQGMNSTVSSRSPTGGDMVKNQMTFSQDDEIDEDVAAHDFPITLIELLNDLEYGHRRHTTVVPVMESRRSYDGDRDSSGTDELSRHIRRLYESCATEPTKNDSMYKDELLSTWTLEPTDLSSHPMNLSKNDILTEDDAFHEIIEPDFTTLASSKDDESSSEESQPPVFMGWCGVMMCTQNDSTLDQSPSDDDDDERSWKKDDSQKRRVFGRRHLLKDDDCIYMTNEASASLHNSLTLSSHYHATGKKKSKLLNEMSERAIHYQVAALQASQDPVSPSDNTAQTEQQQQLHVDDTQHIVGCMRKEICMYSTNGFKDFRADFCVMPEDFKSFDQIGDQQDSMKEERPTFETILVESQKRIHETLVLSGSQEINDDVVLNPRPTESSVEEGIPFPLPFEVFKNWQDISIFSGPMTRLKEIMARVDVHPNGYPRPFQINTSFNCMSSQAVQSPSERQLGHSKGQEVHLELHNNICKPEHGMRRQRTIDFTARRNSSPMDADVLSEATEVLSIDWFADENNEDTQVPMAPNSRPNTGTFSKKAHDEHSKPLVLLMDGLKISNNNMKNGPIGSGDTSIRNNLTSSALGPDDTMQYLQAESYDSEPEPNVSDFVDDDSDDDRSLIDYAALEREEFQRTTKAVTYRALLTV